MMKSFEQACDCFNNGSFTVKNTQRKEDEFREKRLRETKREKEFSGEKYSLTFHYTLRSLYIQSMVMVTTKTNQSLKYGIGP